MLYFRSVLVRSSIIGEVKLVLVDDVRALGRPRELEVVRLSCFQYHCWRHCCQKCFMDWRVGKHWVFPWLIVGLE